ncbi:MAG: hypothetical protein LIP08_10705 [Bacteroides sp.]|nr:hypothetical protein [Bacteroides sp.]
MPKVCVFFFFPERNLFGCACLLAGTCGSLLAVGQLGCCKVCFCQLEESILFDDAQEHCFSESEPCGQQSDGLQG